MYQAILTLFKTILTMNEDRPKESDWKRFRDSLVIWRERYIFELNTELQKMLIQSDKTATEIFWDIYEWQQKKADLLRRCFDDYSRSKMRLKMYLMLESGMLRDEDLNLFSEELQTRLRQWVSSNH